MRPHHHIAKKCLRLYVCCVYVFDTSFGLAGLHVRCVHVLNTSLSIAVKGTVVMHSKPMCNWFEPNLSPNSEMISTVCSLFAASKFACISIVCYIVPWDFQHGSSHTRETPKGCDRCSCQACGNWQKRWHLSWM